MSVTDSPTTVARSCLDEIADPGFEEDRFLGDFGLLIFTAHL